MFPLLTFASGLVAGVLGVRLLKAAKNPVRGGDSSADFATAPLADSPLAERTRQGFSKARDDLRRTTVSGLESLEKSSAALRDKLTSPDITVLESAEDAAAPDIGTPEDSPKKPATRRRRPKKPTSDTPPASGPDEGAVS